MHVGSAQSIDFVEIARQDMRRIVIIINLQTWMERKVAEMDVLEKPRIKNNNGLSRDSSWTQTSSKCSPRATVTYKRH